jgi:proline iminopeptidase
MTKLKKEKSKKNIKVKDSLYPNLNPFEVGHLVVGQKCRNEIYYEVSGNPQGVPVVFIHGGPGSGTSPWQRRFFDPKFYKIILFDQRGCGQSYPRASIEENTTWDLVGDMEVLRKHLKVKKWVLFGGSWGSTLALSYVTKHHQQVLGMVLRGIFLCRPSELKWFYEGEGAQQIFFDEWQGFLEQAKGKTPRESYIKHYYKLLTHQDPQVALKAALAWSAWEGATSQLIPDEKFKQDHLDPHFALSFSRIECHYFVNNAFFPSENFLLDEVRKNPKIQKLPGFIIQGRYDVVCPFKSAWELSQTWKKANLVICQDAGHSAKEKSIKKELVKSMEEMKKYLS